MDYFNKELLNIEMNKYWKNDIYYEFNDIHQEFIKNIINKYNIEDINDKNRLYAILSVNYENNITENKDNYLIISLYNDKRIDRTLELLFCLAKNLLNKNIHEIHILFEGDKGDQSLMIDILLYLQNNIENKIIIEYKNSRHEFNYIFDYSVKNIPDKTIIVANSDIVFDDSLEIINERIDEDIFVVCTRQEYINNQWDNKKYIINKTKRRIPRQEYIYSIDIGSQDVWIYKSNTNIKYVHLKLEYYIGEMNSDSYINNILFKSKYKTYSLGCHIKCYHVHFTSIPLSENKILNKIVRFKDTTLLNIDYTENINDFYDKINYNKFK